MRIHRARRGVASIVGTVIFLVVFMLALGALSYVSGIQAENSKAEVAAENVAAARGAESLVMEGGPSGLTALNGGGTTLSLNHLILRFPNGTIYALAVGATLPPGGTVSVGGIVPQQTCSPGSATCLSKFDQIVGGNPPGSGVGLLTSLGNVFWYVRTAASASGNSVTVAAPVTSSGTKNYISTGLTADLSAGQTYAFFAFIAVSPQQGTEQYDFEVHSLPAGATLLGACSPLSYPYPTGTQLPKCVSTTGKPIANPYSFGSPPPSWETSGIFGTLTMGSAPGAFEIDFACTANCGSVTVDQGSFLMVEAVG